MGACVVTENQAEWLWNKDKEDREELLQKIVWDEWAKKLRKEREEKWADLEIWDIFAASLMYINCVCVCVYVYISVCACVCVSDLAL